MSNLHSRKFATCHYEQRRSLEYFNRLFLNEMGSESLLLVNCLVCGYGTERGRGLFLLGETT